MDSQNKLLIILSFSFFLYKCDNKDNLKNGKTKTDLLKDTTFILGDKNSSYKIIEVSS
jgi:hypothetical protein